MDIQKRYQTQRVDIVIYPGFKSLEAVGALNVFEYANTRMTEVGLSGAYDIRICAPEPGMISSDTQIVLEASHELSQNSDIVLIIGARDINRALSNNFRLIEWCKKIARHSNTLVGVCSGTFFLAEAGLLNGLNATTHWSVSDELQKRYPEIDVIGDAIFLQAGNIWTSAGVSAVLDLSLALVERDFGREVALAVARDLVVYLKRPGGQSQFSQHLSSQMTQHKGISQLQEWILKNLDQPLDIRKLSAYAAMSSRNLCRVFLREVSCSPREFVERARIELARRQLEESQAPLKQIAKRCGFTSDDHFRRVFQRRCGVTPKDYQERFGIANRSTQ